MNKNFIKGFGIGLLSVACLEVYNRIINEYSKKYIHNVNKGFYYTWKEGSVHYNVTGEGKPILLIHDLSVLSSDYEWSKITDKLSENHTVYTIDLLGCALSDKPDITYTNYTFVQMISQFCEDVIKEKCDVITSNDSSSIAIMAQKINDVFNNIILINPAPFDIFAMETTKFDLIEKKIIYLPVVGTALYNHYASENKIRETLDSYLYNKRNIEEISDAFYEASHMNNSKGRFLYACKKCSYLTCDVRVALSEIKNVHIIVGEKTYNRTADEYKNVNGKVKVKTVADAAYFPHLENADATTKVIKEIID